MSDARRDSYGRYSIVPPNGGKPRGYTRATTVAKTLDDGGGLIPWKACATVVGMLRRPGLSARWQALVAEHPDPWYDSPDSKNAAKKLVEECATAGGSSDRAEIGTALHALLEQQLRGGAGTPILQPGMQADIDAFNATIAAAGITFNRELIEAVVVLDEHQVSGTADQLEAIMPDGRHVVADLKTGTDLKYSWQAITIQLATYAHADNVYVQGPAADGSQDKRLPMPELSKEVGLVIHLPAGEARCDLYLIDLVAGWEMFLTSMAVRNWRKRSNLARKHVVAATALPGFDDAPPTIAGAGVVDGDTTKPAATGPSAPAPASVIPDFDAPPTIAPAEAPPASTPPLALSPAEQQQIVRTRPFAGEGDDASDSFTALQAKYEAMPANGRAWVKALALQGIQAGVSFHASQARTVRRFEIMRGVVLLAHHDAAEDEVLRALLEHVIGDVAHFAAVTPGQLLGSLDVHEATRFAQQVDQFLAGSMVASINDSGQFSLRPAA